MLHLCNLYWNLVRFFQLRFFARPTKAKRRAFQTLSFTCRWLEKNTGMQKCPSRLLCKNKTAKRSSIYLVLTPLSGQLSTSTVWITEIIGTVNLFLNPCLCVCRIIAVIFRLLGTFSEAYSANLTAFLSPQLVSSMMWFLQNWVQSYLLLKNTGSSEVRVPSKVVVFVGFPHTCKLIFKF